MKRQLLIALLLGLSTSICYSQVKINVQAGTGLTGITKNENYNANFGYRFGLGVEFPINRTWSLLTGLQFLNRSYSFDEGATQILHVPSVTGLEKLYHCSFNSKINALYLQIPLKMAFYLPFDSQCGLQFSAGPYIAYGIGGKSSLNWLLATSESINTDDLTEGSPNTSLEQGKESHKTFSKDGGLKRLDIGLSLGVDFKYKRFFAGIGAEYGFLPIDKEFPKDLFRYIFQEDQKLVSPRNIGVELHVGFCFYAGK